MTWVAMAITAGGAAALTAGAWTVYRRSRQYARLSAAADAEALEPMTAFPTLAVANALHLATVLADSQPPVDAYLQRFDPAMQGQVGVTERELVFLLQHQPRFHIPMSRVEDVALIGSFRKHRGDESGTLLRVTWGRGGVRLMSVFLVQGKRIDAERVRREMHFRIVRVPSLGPLQG